MTATRTRFEQELAMLQEKILEMATCADVMVAAAVEGLIRGDLDTLEGVILRDDSIDILDLEIENQCLHLIATQQPVGEDLRIIGTALKVITDIERIGDYAVDIAKIGRRLARNQELYFPLVDLPHITELSRKMLHDALQAFVHHDLDLVAKVISDDDAVDALYHKMRDDLTQTLMQDNARSYLCISLLFAAKSLERIGDHIVNIAERVSFIETGVLPSHPHLLQSEAF
jgi:phosphate transport system protein